MSFWYFFKLGFLFIYTSICAALAYYIYNGEKKYYEPIFVMKKTGEGKDDEKRIYLHDEFDELARKDDPISYWKIFFGVFTMIFVKLIISISLAIFFTLKMFKKFKEKNSKKEKYTKEEIQAIIEATKKYTSYFLKITGIFYFKTRLPDEKVLPVYQKYFGPDYKIDYDGKFSCYICNHTSFNDIILAMAIYGCGFISKESVIRTPIIGKIAQVLQTIFVDRNNPNSRKEVLEKIIQKQKNFLNGEPVIPFMIFPEGTTTSGRHLLKFKRGAFYSLLPIKPNIVHPNLNPHFHLGCGSTDVGVNYLRSLTELFVQTEYIELPIMTPNDYMKNNFTSYGKEDWEIYAEVAREIMCELGGFKKSDKHYRDSARYKYCIKNHVYVESDKLKME